MKALIVIPLLIVAASCSKFKSTSHPTAGSAFAGVWTGTYSSTMSAIPGSFDTGTVRITVDAGNNATGTLQSLIGGGPVIMKGAVDPSTGVISIAYDGEGTYGGTVFLEGLSGYLIADSGSGKIAFPWASISGWSATKN